MLQRYLIVVVLLSLCSFTFAQSGYNVRIGGGGYEEATAGIARGTDGSIYMAGSTASFGTSADFLHRNAYVVKLDPTGIIAWTRAIGGTNDEAAYGLAATTDGGCIITGYAQQTQTTNRDLFVIKLSATGTVEWNHNFGDFGYETGYAVVEDGVGGYVVAGTTTSLGWGSSDIYVVRLNADGEPIWKKVYGTPYADEAIDIVRTSDGKIALAGSMFVDGTGMQSPALFKIDLDGEVQWDHLYVVGTSMLGHIFSMIELANGELQLAGSYQGIDDGDMLLVRTSANGELLWAKRGYLLFPQTEWLEDLLQTENGDLVLAGWRYSDTHEGPMLVRLDGSASGPPTVSLPGASITFDDARIEGVLDNLNGTFTLGGSILWDDGQFGRDFHVFMTGPDMSGMLTPCFGGIGEAEFVSLTLGDQAFLNPSNEGGQIGTPTWDTSTGGDVNVLCDNIGLAVRPTTPEAAIGIATLPGSIQLRGPVQGNTQYALFDAAGRTVAGGTMPATGTLSTSHLALGTYVLRLSTQEEAQFTTLRFEVVR